MCLLRGRGVVGDVAVRQRGPTTGRVNLQEGIEKARPLILPKVKVTVIEVREAKESNWKKVFRVCKKKRGKEGKSMDQDISQEAEMINHIKKKTPAYQTKKTFFSVYWQLNDFHIDNTITN